MVELNLKRGNILEADAEALVNSVNTVGIMGKGVALQFKQAFPENFTAYAQACKRGEVQPGKIFVFPTGRLGNPQYILNFPTKRHWRQKSKLTDIETGLGDLVSIIQRLAISSIAIPPLGCGNGGLEWSAVHPLIAQAVQSLEDVEVQLYEPVGSPDPMQMPVATARPRMTPGRAGLLGILGNYKVPGYRLAQLEIQKLAYFLQAAGEPLTLDFAKDKYGPYAAKLNHVLQRMEGHYIRGYGDRTHGAKPIHIYDEAVDEARAYLVGRPVTLHRFSRVGELIEGYETPYGLELLATVHWVVAREDMCAQVDAALAIAGVHKWNKRKRDLFSGNHIAGAWDRLKAQEWFKICP